MGVILVLFSDKIRILYYKIMNQDSKIIEINIDVNKDYYTGL